MNPRLSGDKGPDPRRRSLELARTDVMRRLEAAGSGPLRDMLGRALADVEERLRRLDSESRAQE